MDDPCIFEDEREPAENYVSRIAEENLEEVIEHFEEQVAELEEMLLHDYRNGLQTEETLAAYIRAIQRTRDILFHLCKRFYDGPEEDDGMGDITEALEQTALKN
jgi:uncharacterized protein YutE (UPF0331/DUF86 family)